MTFKSKPFDVVGFGFNSVDQLCIVPEFPNPDSKTEILQYAKLAGGQTATALVFLARMGLRVKYIGKIGGDQNGQISLQSLKGEDLDISNVMVEEKCINHHAIIIIDQNLGERTILCQSDPNMMFAEDELKREDICAGRILHIDGYDPCSALRASIWCQEQGIYVSADLDRVVPGCEEIIKHVDFLITSKDFPSELTGNRDLTQSISELGNCFGGFLAVTLGKQGAIAWIEGRCEYFPALEIKAVDTTGAGDIFHGAFLYGILQNWPLNSIMAFANAAAGLSCKYLGARTGIRPLSEIMEYAQQLMATSVQGN